MGNKTKRQLNNAARCKAYYHKNKEKLKQKRKKNRKHLLEIRRLHYAKNREKHLAWSKATRERHKEEYKLRQREYARKNRAKIRAYRKQYLIDNYDKVSSDVNKRRAMKKQATGSHTLEEWSELRDKTKGICPCCKKKVGLKKLTRDHITPLVRGGTDDIDNIQPLCRSCNCSKHTETIKYI